jgi:hypothetical protein
MNLRISVSLIGFESWSLQQVPLMSLGMYTLRRAFGLNPGFIVQRIWFHSMIVPMQSIR